MSSSSSSIQITLRLPSRYTNPSSSSSLGKPKLINPPPLSFLHRTWTVTHSTLSMWRSSRNVRITYGALSANPNQPERMTDLVQHEPIFKGDDNEEVRKRKGSVKRIRGVDTVSLRDENNTSTLSWDWRGSGWLFWIGSHWEVLGWGEKVVEGEVVERWAVTWFEQTWVTEEGIDVYSDRKEGGSEEVVRAIMEELRRVCKGQGRLEGIVGKMRSVEVRLPWLE
ncbi:uncharacterized protein CTHT_0006640 [Thermochaetoides thermophila DSM 1495]|uniref:Uncharacterized protein n=1 Tax=Chaetomium thermophilum (strain DSM 1495 / CBS 144.50 / IMI 039719) TaxID=759272 RepID=G0RYG8_CHATD|nr:hypothetical protein CTHT_0006640 [Thermochaetoides thermophila DSM 1495]EGS23954.1 hypothetical protein CTHT_0006640 [Thermochaetoides thermophila DSM 1495]